jgi:hypothetical protein
LNFLDRFCSTPLLPPIQNKKIRPVGAELYHTDRQTNAVKLTVAFRNFAKTPNNTPVAKCFFFCIEVRWFINICVKLNKCAECNYMYIVFRNILKFSGADFNFQVPFLYLISFKFRAVVLS